MTARKPLVAGNWKLNLNMAEGSSLASALVAAVGSVTEVDVAVAPVFTVLSSVSQVLKGSTIALSAQDMYVEDKGAFTGAVGPAHLLDVGCTYTILGHSERRQYFGESDSEVAKKVQVALAHGLSPIVCVGESLETRESGQAEVFVSNQVRAALGGLTAEQLKKVVVAYEPIWAIGTGKTASPGDAQAMHAALRATVLDLHGAEVASELRILYGGSVNAENAASLMSQPDIDGALVGGASLKLDSFVAIVRAAR